MDMHSMNVLDAHGLENMDRQQQIAKLTRAIQHLEQSERQFTPDNQDIPHPVIDELNLVLSELLLNRAIDC
ncbi:hypothetical protein EDB69_3203 [Vibrio crassostreae]|nr:hypothetical protein EDB64_2923 [Vibrio crassostreae]ROP08653.1 hypothetical protein EDB63_2657 [Vibrio crassostreae]RPE91451.1 hypothetical protein EDB68_2660 [Vibrio crassostreae]RPF14714.1 hypothetical protein EDB69_3203 [Vibrio crassostreae]